MGLSDKPNIDSVKLYCPCCKEIYNPPKAFDGSIGCSFLHIALDGAFFGTTFPHMFLLQYPRYLSTPSQSYEPMIFGYKIHQSRFEIYRCDNHVVHIMRNQRKGRGRRRKWILSDYSVCWNKEVNPKHGLSDHRNM